MYISKKVYAQFAGSGETGVCRREINFHHIPLSALSLCGTTEFMANEWRNDRARTSLTFYCVSQN
jgi:hypothetical protein